MAAAPFYVSPGSSGPHQKWGGAVRRTSVLGLPKTLAQGQFICPEHVKSIWDPIESCWLSMGSLGDVAEYLGNDAFFNLK